MNDLWIRRAALVWTGCTALFLVLAGPLTASPALKAKTPEACGCCLPKAALPVALSSGKSNDGWTLSFDVPPYSGFTEMFVRFDDRPYLTLPQSTRSACAQAVFRDGTLSRALELRRTAPGRVP